MKFFLELGFCFGGTAVSMDVATTVTLPLPPTPARNEVHERPPCRGSRRRLMKVHNSSSTVQWKPELSAIAEDRVVSDGRKKEELFAGDQPPAKRASKYGTDYRKSCHRMVIPAFSPTPFVF